MDMQMDLESNSDSSFIEQLYDNCNKLYTWVQVIQPSIMKDYLLKNILLNLMNFFNC